MTILEVFNLTRCRGKASLKVTKMKKVRVHFALHQCLKSEAWTKFFLDEFPRGSRCHSIWPIL